MQTTGDRTSSTAASGRVGRVLWPIGWALLLIVSTCGAYALLVLGGK